MLCLEIRKASVRTWNDLITAAALSARLGEESITDYLVLELAKNQIFGNYQVNSFTKPEESINGADWEIWLTGPSGKWFGLRLQAKVIKVGVNRFVQLHKPTPAAGATSATQRLIDTAAKVSALPLYLLYCAWTPNPHAPLWSCSSYPKDDRLWGLSFVEADNILLIKPKTTLKALAPHMLTAHCMFCCGTYGGKDLPTRAHSFSKVKFPKSEPKLLDSAPPHLQHLINSPAGRHAELRWPDDNLGRITVLTQGNSTARPKG